MIIYYLFFFQAEDGIRDHCVTEFRRVLFRSVDHRNRQPFGFLSGGASLALAENIAGVGSLAICPGKISVGVSVSGTHVKAVLEGDVVEATATLIHKGKTLHTWHVEIKNSEEELISSVTVTNYIIKPRE